MTRHNRRRGRRFWPIGTLFVPLFGLVGVVGIGARGGDGPMVHHWWWGVPLFGPLGMLLAFLLIVALVVWFAHWLVAGAGEDRARADAQVRDGDRALAILRERFARGEIDEDEYLRRLRLLSNGEESRDR